MSKILIVYASRDGHTRSICELVLQRLQAAGHDLQLTEIGAAAQLSPADFDAVAVGGSVIYGKHDPRLVRFIEDHAEQFKQIPLAFFSVNLIARRAVKQTIEGNVYVRKFLDVLPIKPRHVEIIAGKLDYPSYGWLDRILIQLTMKFTDGPTDRHAVIDYTDYEQVDRFADRLAKLAASCS
ncbi:MAG: menaquinone-dependent protoporphyrinogen IX dehydrogenase [Wenzhouxiangella sp.]